MPVFPEKISRGSHIRVIAPSRSFKIISEETREIALKRFAELGIRISYSKNADEIDEFVSSSVQARVRDLHEAFADPTVDCVLTAIGGFNSNEMLPFLDYDLIAKNPKIFCGFSDITALHNAIIAKTGLVTYYGTHFSSFGMAQGFDYTYEGFIKCLMNDKPYKVDPSLEWSDDTWFLDQDKREFIKNDGYWLLNEGANSVVEGKIMGGNLCTLNLLQGTDYMPNMEGSVLFVEDTASSNDALFSRDLTSLLQEKSVRNIKALVIGRFQKGSNISREKLLAIVKSKPELKDVPVIGNVDFGHTTPFVTFPLGGKVKIDGIEIEVLEH